MLPSASNRENMCIHWSPTHLLLKIGALPSLGFSYQMTEYVDTALSDLVFVIIRYRKAIFVWKQFKQNIRMTVFS